jgi:hypothetical protein
MGQPSWAGRKQAVDYLEKATKKTNAMALKMEIAQHVLSQPDWEKQPRTVEWIRRIIKSRMGTSALAFYVLPRAYWAGNPAGADLVREYIEAHRKLPFYAANLTPNNPLYDLATYVFSQPHWAQHPEGPALLRTLIGVTEKLHPTIVRDVLAQSHWAELPEALDLLRPILAAGNADKEIESSLLTRAAWREKLKTLGEGDWTSERLRAALGVEKNGPRTTMQACRAALYHFRNRYR